jgi:hypothetical protein
MERAPSVLRMKHAPPSDPLSSTRSGAMINAGVARSRVGAKHGG